MKVNLSINDETFKGCEENEYNGYLLKTLFNIQQKIKLKNNIPTKTFMCVVDYFGDVYSMKELFEISDLVHYLTMKTDSFFAFDAIACEFLYNELDIKDYEEIMNTKREKMVKTFLIFIGNYC